MKKILIGIVGIVALAATANAGLATFNNGGIGSNWSNSTNWLGQAQPASDTDSVSITGAAAVMDEAFRLGSGLTLTSTLGGTAIQMRLSTSDLTLGKGSTTTLGNVVILNNSAQGDITFEAGANISMNKLIIDNVLTTKWIADANGVSAVNIADKLDLNSKGLGGPVVELDLAHYVLQDAVNGDTLTLYNYGSLILKGAETFKSVTATPGWTVSNVDYGTSAISVTVIPEPTTIGMLGLASVVLLAARRFRR